MNEYLINVLYNLRIAVFIIDIVISIILLFIVISYIASWVISSDYGENEELVKMKFLKLIKCLLMFVLILTSMLILLP